MSLSISILSQSIGPKVSQIQVLFPPIVQSILPILSKQTFLEKPLFYRFTRYPHIEYGNCKRNRAPTPFSLRTDACLSEYVHHSFDLDANICRTERARDVGTPSVSRPIPY